MMKTGGVVADQPDDVKRRLSLIGEAAQCRIRIRIRTHPSPPFLLFFSLQSFFPFLFSFCLDRG
jgi:hypothetical protein